MKRRTVRHLDTEAFARVLDLAGPVGRRVLAALLTLAPDGILVGRERKFATTAGFASVAELRPALADLSRTMVNGHSILALDTLRGEPRTALIGVPGMWVDHHEGPGPQAPAEVPAKRISPVVDLIGARDAARLLILDAPLLAAADAWVAHMASLEPDGLLPERLQADEYATIGDLAARYGAEATFAALEATQRKFATERPEHGGRAFVTSVTRSEYAKRAASPSMKRAAVMADEDMF